MKDNKNKKRKRIPILRSEILIMIMIFICLTIQSFITADKNVNGDVTFVNDTELVVCGDNSIKEQYSTDSNISCDQESLCYFEVFDSNMNTIIRRSYIDSKHDYRIISENQDLISDYMSNNTGVLNVAVGDDICEVVYKWAESPNRHLVICASSKVIKRNILISHILFYVIISLCFIMISVITHRQLSDASKRYEEISNEVSRKITQ